MASNETRTYALLVLILIAGSCLRLYELRLQSLDIDELFEWDLAKKNTNLLDAFQSSTNPHPPAHAIIYYLLIRYVGDSESILRLPSTVSGILSILSMFLLGRSLFSEKEGLMASCLAAVLSAPVFFSQYASSYSALFFLSSLSVYFWFTIVKSVDYPFRPPTWSIVGYISVAVALSYLHYFGLYLVCLQGIAMSVMFINKINGLKQVFYLYAPVVIAYIPWIPVAWWHFKNLRIIVWSLGLPPIPYIKYLLFCFNDSVVILCIFMTLFLVYLLNGLYSLNSSGGIKRALTLSKVDFLLMAWAYVPYAGAYPIGLIYGIPLLNIYSPYYLIISLPAIILLASRSIVKLPVKSWIKAVISCGIIILCLHNLIYDMHYYSAITLEQIRDVAAYVVRHDRQYPDSAIIACTYSKSYFDYYFIHGGSEKRTSMLACKISEIGTITETIDHHRHRYLWYLWARTEPDSNLVDFLKNNLSIIDHKDFNRAGLWLFDAEPSRNATSV